MELELQQEHFACYQALPQLCDTHEETMETIVPDYCPDIARIVDASGCLFLRSREITEGKIGVSGTVKMTLLYMAEDTQGIRSLDYSIPVDYALEGRFGKGVGEVCMEGHISAPDVRMLNPRKIFTRVTIDLCLTLYEPTTLTTCGGIAEKEAYKIETLCENHDISLIQGIREKDFVFSEEIVLSSVKEPVRELLRSQCRLRVTECKSVGNKLILKGVACLDVLYLTDSGVISQMSSELPFSQIIEGKEDAGAAIYCDALLRLTGCEIRIGSDNAPDDTHTISLKLFISAFVVLRQTKSICCIADLYSTAYDLNAKSEQIALSETPELFLRQQMLREQLETGVAVQTILCTDVTFGNVSVSRNGDGCTLRATANIKVLYLDENGSPLLCERRAEVSLDTDIPAAGRISVRSVCANDMMTSVTAGGIEVRCPVEFTVAAATAPCYPCLMSLSAEKQENTSLNMPSLVLRALSSGETLWNLAKQYRTTVEDILKANEMAEEAAAKVGQLLLIPRKR